MFQTTNKAVENLVGGDGGVEEWEALGTSLYEHHMIAVCSSYIFFANQIITL